MVLPSAMPEGPRVIASLVLVQLGVVGLFWTLLVAGDAGPVWAVLAVAGILAFLSCAAWMRRHPRPSPPARPWPGWGVFHAVQALAYLVIASGIGLTLVVMPTTAWTARLSMLYGIVALIGFLSQVVVGMEHRILPLFEWHTQFRASGFGTKPPPTHVMGSQSLRAAVFGLWTVGMPVLAVGMSTESSIVVGIGGWVILGALMLHTMNTIRTLRSPALATRQVPFATQN